MTAKLSIQTRPGTTIHLDGDDPKKAIAILTKWDAMLTEQHCGACQSPQIVPRHRQAQGYDFYNLSCLKCGHRLEFGQLREGGGLFPKRKDDQGNWLENNGWTKWQKEGGQNQSPSGYGPQNGSGRDEYSEPASAPRDANQAFQEARSAAGETLADNEDIPF